jgi:carboxyl-terminal processing protease
VRGAADPIAACDRWLAQLQDAHTRVWPAAPQGHLPYALRVVGNAATFARVPAGTAARDAGVRPGWRLTALDGAAVEASAWLARTGASGHARPYIAGRRLLAAPAGAERELAAVSPEGHDASWQEPARPIPFDELVTRRRLPSGAGYVRIEAWAAGAGIEDALDEALSELRGADRLIVDLRGNPGGNLVLACATRQRFLRRETSLGSIRHSIGGGRLSQPYPLVAEPAAEGQRWRGRLIVLTDPLTYSSSEDFLLGLQGLDHVFVVGQPSGGGSGRPRSLRLLEGTTLTISTALTYDRLGRCIEGAGIPVDLQVPALPQVEPDPVLAAAESV